MVRAGIGDVVSNLSAIADWELAAATAASRSTGWPSPWPAPPREAVLHQPGTVGDDDFLTVLAEALVLSGMAMSVAGSSRPASGGCHEILHAIDLLFPGTGNHGELVGVGALFCTFLRGEDRGRALTRRLPAPARAAPDPGRPRAQRGRVRRGGAVRPGDPAGPLHHPRAPRRWTSARSRERVADFAAAFGSER